MTETWILYASIAVWFGIGCYAAFLGAVQRRLDKKLAQLELMNDKDS